MHVVLLGSCPVSVFLPLHWCGLEVSTLSVTVPHLKGSTSLVKDRSVKYHKTALVTYSTEGWPCGATWALASVLMVGFQSHPGEEPGFAPLLLIGCYARHVAS